MTTDHRRILVIDDERPILMTLEALLDGAVTTGDGRHCCPRLRLLKN